MKRKSKSEVSMKVVRVLQGCSISEMGIWHHQGAIVQVADPSIFTKTVVDDKGKESVVSCVEPAEPAEINIPDGILPKAVEAEPKGPSEATHQEEG